MLTPNVSAQEKVLRVAEITFNDGTFVYQKGTWVNDATARDLNEFLASQEMPVVLVIANSTGGERFRMADGKELSGYRAVDFALGPHGLMSQPGFKALADKESGLPNGSVIFVCPEAQPELNGKRPWNFYSSPFLDSIGLAWDSVWIDDIETEGISYLKKGEVDLAVKKSVESYIQRVDQTRRAKATVAVIGWLFPRLFLVGIGIICTLALWHRRDAVKRAERRVRERLSDWQTALAGKSQLLEELNKRKIKIFGNTREELTLTGHDRKLAELAIDKIARARLLMQVALKTVQRVKSNVEGVRSVFSTSPYDDAIATLDRRLRFDPRDKVEEALSGEAASEQEYLWAPLESFQPFETSFEELIRTFNEITREASDNIDRLEAARSEAINALSGAKTTVEALQIAEDLDPEDPVVKRLTSAIDDARADLSVEVRDANTRVLNAPLEQGELARALVQRAQQAQAVIDCVQQVVRSRDEREAQYAELEKRGVSLTWAQTRSGEVVNELLVVVNAVADSEAGWLERSQSAIAKATELLAIGGKVTSLLDNHAQLRSRLDSATERLNKLVAELRSGANSRGCDNDFFEGDPEHSGIPRTHLEVAEGCLESVLSNIGTVSLDMSLMTLEFIDEQIKTATQCMDAWNEANQRYESTMESLSSQSDEIAGEVQDAIGLIGQLAVFDNRFLETPPDGDHLTTLQRSWGDSLRKAAEYKRARKMLAADAALRQAETSASEIRATIAAIKHVHKKAFDFDAENAERINTLASRITEHLSDDFAFTTRKTTSSHLRQTEEALQKCVRQQQESGRDPSEVRHSIAEVERGVGEYEVDVKRDADEHDECAQRLGALTSRLTAIEDLLQAMEGDQDGLPDTAPLEKAGQFVRETRQDELPDLQANLKVAHTDWFKLDDQIAQVLERAESHIAALRRESEQGQAALSALAEARKRAHDVRAWTGRYVRQASVDPNWKRDLSCAEEDLQRGNYDQALQRAGAVLESCTQALNVAKSKERKANREAERERAAEEDAERRRLRNRDSSASGTTILFGGSTYDGLFGGSSSDASTGGPSSGGICDFSSGGGGSGITSSDSGGGGSGW